MVTKVRKMTENREYSALRRSIARVDDIYGRAISFYLTHDEIQELVVKEVFEHTSMKRATKATVSYIHGYCEAKRNETYRYHVKWMMWVMSIDGLSGELMFREEIDALTKREMSGSYLPKDYRSPISRVNSDKSRHVWMRDGVGLKLKPYDIKWKGEPYYEMAQTSEKEYVLLRGIQEGNKFFTTNVKGEDPTKLIDGTVAYTIIGWADTVEEAQMKLYGKTFASTPVAVAVYA